MPEDNPSRRFDRRAPTLAAVILKEATAMYTQAVLPTQSLPGQIILTDKRELRSWAQHYGVSENQLLRAVNAVGDSRFRVEGWLKYQGLLIA